MIAAGQHRWIRLTSSIAFGAATLLASVGFAQNSKWAPSRTAAGNAPATVEYAAPAMHSSAVRSTVNVGEATRPEWQQSPVEQQAVVRSSATTQTAARSQTAGRSPAAARAKPAPANTQATHFHSVAPRVPQPRAVVDGRLVAHQTNAQSLRDYNIRLADGEKLVGQPTITENGPLNGTQLNNQPSAAPSFGGRTAVQGNVPRNTVPSNTMPSNVRGEMIPVPDNVSGGGSFQGRISGPIYNEDGTEYHGPMLSDGSFDPNADIDLDPNFDGFAGHEEGGCTSCTSGNCGGTCQRDEWADPDRCPECGLYGSHMIGCGHVARCLHNCLGFLFKEASVFAGTQGFKGPLDLGVNGNFGFNEGFNLGGALVPFPKYGLGYQVGARWAQSDLSGNVFGSAAREQVFLTAGVFHRAYRGCGFQWGLAFDWATDNYYTKATYSQVRMETSWLFPRGHEFGFMGVFGAQSDQVTFTVLGINVVNQQIKPTDQYNFFYRYTTRYGGQGRFWGGWTGQNLTIFGSDFRVPMSNRTDLIGGFNYIMPPSGQNGNGTAAESWGLSMNIVWYFGRPREGIHNTPFRPLFQTADNNVMMLDRP